MRISTKATNMTLTPAVESYLLKKLGSLDRFVDHGDESAAMAVEIAKTTAHHRNGEIFRAEVNMHIKGKDLYVESEKEDLYAAIDDVRDEIERSLKSVKTKRLDLLKRGGAKIKAIIKGFYRK